MVKVIILMMLMVSFAVSADSDKSFNINDKVKDIGLPKEGTIEWEKRMPNIVPRKGELVRKQIKVAKYGNTMIVFPNECFLHVEIDYQPNMPSAINGVDLKCPQ